MVFSAQQAKQNREARTSLVMKTKGLNAGKHEDKNIEVSTSHWPGITHSVIQTDKREDSKRRKRSPRGSRWYLWLSPQQKIGKISCCWECAGRETGEEGRQCPAGSVLPEAARIPPFSEPWARGSRVLGLRTGGFSAPGFFSLRKCMKRFPRMMAFAPPRTQRLNF